MAAEKPKLIFHAHSERRPYFRRFAWLVLGAVAAAAGVIALDYAAGRGLIDGDLARVGWAFGIVGGALLALRAVLNLLRWLTTRNETLRFYDRGFAWARGKRQYQYRWSQIVRFREGVHDVYLFGRPLIQRGAIVLTMRDGEVFKVTGAHGDTRRFVRAFRPIIADVTGTRIGQSLRSNKPVRIHKDLSIWPRGIKIGKQQIAWEQVDVTLKRSRLTIARLNKKGKFKKVKGFDTHTLDNVGGFMEVATATIRNHQPERFNIKTIRRQVEG